VDALPRALGGFRFLFVAINTFTKWMEAMLVVNITQDAVVKFLQSINYKFGVPKWVLTNNGSQLKGAKFTRCCTYFDINHQASSTAHPQMNDQVECANWLILQEMKTRMFHDLEAKGRNWHEELPSVLPPEIFLESARVAQFNEADQDEGRELNFILLEENCNNAIANVQKYQESLKSYYNKSIVPRQLGIGDIVLKKDIHTKDKHKFSSP
jgi:transposase InsO family protein